MSLTGKKQNLILTMRAEGASTAEIAERAGMSVRSVQREVRTTAYHEAGHVVAQMLAEAMGPGSVTIRPDGKGNLGLAPQFGVDLDSEVGLRDEIINCYAGAAVERVLGNSDKRIKMGAEFDDDSAVPQLRRLLLCLGKDVENDQEGDSLKEELRKAATDLIRSHWHWVERVAKELFRCTTLSGEELESLQGVLSGNGTEGDLYVTRWILSRAGQLKGSTWVATKKEVFEARHAMCRHEEQVVRGPII